MSHLLYSLRHYFPAFVLGVKVVSITWYASSPERRNFSFVSHITFSPFFTWKIFLIIEVVVVGQFHAITPLPGGKECLLQNLDLSPTGDLRGRFLSFIIPLKDPK